MNMPYDHHEVPIDNPDDTHRDQQPGIPDEEIRMAVRDALIGVGNPGSKESGWG